MEEVHACIHNLWLMKCFRCAIFRPLLWKLKVVLNADYVHCIIIRNLHLAILCVCVCV